VIGDIPAIGAGRMADNPFQDWRREYEAVSKEMDRLISAGYPQSREERQIRRLQYTALIERRDAAIKKFLRSSSPRR